MKAQIVSIFFLIMCPLFLQGQDLDMKSPDTEKSKKEIRKEKRKLARKQLTQHFNIGANATYTFVNSSARFEGKNSILSAQINLEKHLGLADKKWVYTGFFIYRITPRSGINGNYYQLNRTADKITANDIIFMDDTIQKGTVVSSYFNTRIASFGYLFSILTDQNAHLALFINFYFAQIKLGVHAESIKVNRHVTYIAATPNFGFVASFRIKKWFTIGGAVGMFFYNTKNLSGTFYDLGIFGEFYPAKWIGLNIGYKVFNVSVKFPEENYNAYIDYNLRGPSAGIRFRF